ncbi:hypothetical protein TNCT_497121 [Trichonephila clavata]|uniref:Uncharacterized protein n=1 Tax=Trichonephila clavata TaxID=2740835 RepID=A0A8X6KZH1_TRICU|nr:hypothetical protein TNCT_497121 [Trichonephila clavata]
MRAQRLMFHSDSVVSRRREGDHTSYRSQLNMQASKKEQQRVIRFLAVEGSGGREMHRRMKAAYDEYSQCRLSLWTGARD